MTSLEPFAVNYQSHLPRAAALGVTTEAPMQGTQFVHIKPPYFDDLIGNVIVAHEDFLANNELIGAINDFDAKAVAVKADK